MFQMEIKEDLVFPLDSLARAFNVPASYMVNSLLEAIVEAHNRDPEDGLYLKWDYENECWFWISSPEDE